MGNLSLKRFISATAICAVSAMASTVSNPIIWGDVPDVSTIRVDDAYYMVSTTMHFAPGVPVMKSTNLAQWRTVSYAYETLIDNDAMNLNGGKNAYGK
ncbi:MAG: family 43 glycosylhydrolase, partial [Fibrobacter sp.]|nr:family 43 glycosylhydrolase [Fibrobacter sp.]